MGWASKIVEAQSTYFFIVQDMMKGNKESLHVQPMLLYLIDGKEGLPFEKKNDQATYLPMPYHLVDGITGVRKCKRKESCTYTVVGI